MSRSAPSGTRPTTRGRRIRAGAAALAVVLAIGMPGSLDADSASIQASVRVSPITVRLEISAAQLRAGDTTRALATVTNLGPVKLSSVRVELRVDTAGVHVRGDAVSTISKLQPGHSATVSWTICAVEQGNFVVLAHATVEGGSVDSPARLLSVSGRRPRGCT